MLIDSKVLPSRGGNNSAAMGGGKNQHDNDLLPPPDPTPSYWRSEPHWTDEHRSTPSLSKECDILIIGSGMSGVSAAYHLLRDVEWPEGRPSVVMLEARQACSGATGRNGGHVRFGPSKLQNRIEDEGLTTIADITGFVMDTIHTIKHTIEKEGIFAESEFHRTLDILMDEGEAKKAKESFEALLKNGFPYIDQIDYIGKPFVERVPLYNLLLQLPLLANTC
jgi:FAD dependent oxidoreductase